MKQPLRKCLMLGLLAMLIPLSLLAQDIKVQGVVKDQTEGLFRVLLLCNWCGPDGTRAVGKERPSFTPARYESR